MEQLDSLLAKQKTIRTLDGIELLQQHYLDKDSLTDHNLQDYLDVQSKMAQNRIVRQQEGFTTTPLTRDNQTHRVEIDLDKKNDKVIKMMKLSELNNQLQGIEGQLGVTGQSATVYTDLIDKTNRVQSIIHALKIQNYDDYGNQIRQYIQQLEDITLSKEYLELEQNQVNMVM